jgi:hypothetical protein
VVVRERQKPLLSAIQTGKESWVRKLIEAMMTTFNLKVCGAVFPQMTMEQSET